jgi:MFS transporter, DHA1 family, multidrug resistance protein
MVTMLIFVLMQSPTALTKIIGTLITMRFIAGYIGSPLPAISGAGPADMSPPEDRVIVIGTEP